jgi:hypothetical protein
MLLNGIGFKRGSIEAEMPLFIINILATETSNEK